MYEASSYLEPPLHAPGVVLDELIGPLPQANKSQNLLDPRRAIWGYILALNRREEVTVFLTTHYMEEADYLSHRVAIIDRGRILAVDEPRNLKDMIGGDVVIVSCSDPGPLAEELMRQDWVREVKTRGSEISVYVDRGEKKIPEIVMIAEKLGVAVDSILLREPTLEDVYLKFTGRSIREEIADAVEKMRNIARRRMRR